MKIIFFFLFFVKNLYAVSSVDQVLDRQTILVALDPVHSFKEKDHLIILEQLTLVPLALGEIQEFFSTMSFGEFAKVTILETLDNNLIRPRDSVVKLSEKNIKKFQIPGQYSVTLNKEETLSAKYKDLVYLGVFGSEGHTLSKNEWLFSPFMLQYGLAKNFTLKTEPGLYFDGYPNLGSKWTVAKNKWGTLTLHQLVSREINQNDWIVQGGFLASMPSSSKFQTHFALNINFDGIDRPDVTAEKLKLFKDTDFRVIYEYMTNSWDRVLIGPLFNFEQKTLGGTLSYMWIWDSYHLNMGFGSNNVAEMKFNREAYYFLMDFFWRL